MCMYNKAVTLVIYEPTQLDHGPGYEEHLGHLTLFTRFVVNHLIWDGSLMCTTFVPVVQKVFVFNLES